MSRLGVRTRLTLAFAAAMAIVLAAAGAFVYVQQARSLDRQLDEGLRRRAAALAAGERPLAAGEEEFAQIVDAGGRVVEAAPGVDSPVVRRRPAHEYTTEVADAPVEGGHARILVLPIANGRVVVTGAAVDDRNETLAALLTELLLGGPVVLMLAAGGAYALAGAALRPVESMRRRASEISASDPSRRLPLPAAKDEIFRLARTLNEMLDRLEAGLRRERRFVADASHELRTPLALLRTELELALSRPRPREALEAALASAAEEVERLTRLAEDLLVLAATEPDGALPLRRTGVAAPDLLDAVAARFAARAAAAERTLEASADDVVLSVDRGRLDQALGNLVDNALVHGAGTIRLEAMVEGTTARLSVRDDGRGFPPAFVDRAFERFSRADEARGRGGAGLGLSIVAAIARAHGGGVRIDGSAVAIELPTSVVSHRAAPPHPLDYAAR